MSTHFFQDKPVSQLLGSPTITAEHLNDDCLGRALDKIADYGVTQLFSELAFEIASEKNLLGKRLHLDSTSFTLYGNYEHATDSPKPAHGYSKAHRSDLKQVMLSLTQGGEANLPLWMEALDGNSSDKRSFHETVRRVKEFVTQLKDAPDDICFVVDAAFYDIKKLKELDSVKWITRVPAVLKESKAWLQTETEALNWQKLDEEYQATMQIITVNELTQRWVMIQSKPAYERELKTLQRRLSKAYATLDKTLWHLSNQTFSCIDDATVAVNAVIKKEKYHTVSYEMIPIEKYTAKGRPNKNTPKQIVGYRVGSIIASNLDVIAQHKQRLGRFILGTNQLDKEALSNADILIQYKEQSQVESGFKFIKDDAFELDSIFLSTPKRIAALMMIMTLCLMVYNFAQYHIRKCLNDCNDVLPNQQGKPTQKPTMKWIAEMMVVIAVVTIETEQFKQQIVTNVNQVHRKIIGYFGKSALLIYGLPPDFKQVDIQFDNYKNFLDWCEM